ncbi:hypothetical protein OG455_27025 [Kitasatospora sp. NBC_01287]|uniref:hypothetical protein n=1 Tax=Kitasatospora sp. NBC_01287 TaxID=2903573 RepID=UPI00224F220E|nr:hypothetical protein [Kitasatospora sp. NBC_01287]MCX4749119.1 hypothetical protein [Kitasatospora sp. NBC_01287]
MSFPSGELPWAFSPSPARLIVPELGPTDLLPTGEATRWEQRSARRVELPGPSIGGALRLVVDSQLPIVLCADVPGTEYREELTGLLVHTALPESLFALPVDDPADHGELRCYERTRAHYLSSPLPIPAAWPGALNRPSPIDGDPETGYLVLDLDPVPVPDGFTGAQLIRQPLTDPPYRTGWASDPRTYLHRWRDASWQWTVLVTGRPLTPAELGRLA